jgi:hypothetical protein
MKAEYIGRMVLEAVRFFHPSSPIPHPSCLPATHFFFGGVTVIVTVYVSNS